LASRLESLNKYYGTRNLAGGATLQSLGDRAIWRPVDKVAVKGKVQGTFIGELADEEPDWWAGYRHAWALYQAAQWQTAAEAFSQVRTPEGIDGVSEVLGARCRRFLEKGVPADWTGTWVMQDK
jgi:adenylate cyclase